MSLHALSQHMASKGRNGDSMLLHVTPSEVHGLHGLARAMGTEMTVNPETGLHEANFLKDWLPAILGVGMMMIPGMQGFGMMELAAAGAAVGGATSAAVGNDMSKIGMDALMGGFGGAMGGAMKGLGTGVNAAEQAAAKVAIPGVAGAADAGAITASKAAMQSAPEGLAAAQHGLWSAAPAGGLNDVAQAVMAKNAGTGLMGLPNRTAAQISDLQAQAHIPSFTSVDDVANRWSNAGGFGINPPKIPTFGPDMATGAKAAANNPWEFTKANPISTVGTVGGLASRIPLTGGYDRPPAQDDKPKGEYDYNQNYDQTGQGNRFFDPNYGFTPYAEGGDVEMLANGGIAGLGSYSDARGHKVVGPGTGTSDSVPAYIAREGKIPRPARLSDGEFVLPKQVVNKVGGAKQLYAMMDRIKDGKGKKSGKGHLPA